MTPIEEQYNRNKGYSEIWEGDDNFKKAMVRMFNREKEYNNSKYDLGGETNLGITIGTLNDYKKKNLDFKDVDIKKITKDQASRIYYDEYWKKHAIDNFFITGHLALKKLDTFLAKKSVSKRDIDIYKSWELYSVPTAIVTKKYKISTSNLHKIVCTVNKIISRYGKELLDVA